MARRTFTREQKLSIIKEAEQKGVTPTLRKHGVYPATYYSWRRKFDEMGESGLRHGMTKAKLKEMRKLEKELATLKQINSEKDLQIKMLKDIVKKNLPLWEKRGR